MKFIGLPGIALGTCISNTYRLFSSIYYLKDNILNIEISKIVGQILLDIICIIVIIAISKLFIIRYTTVLVWFLDSALLFFVNFIVVGLIFCIFNFDLVKNMFTYLKRR